MEPTFKPMKTTITLEMSLYDSRLVWKAIIESLKSREFCQKIGELGTERLVDIQDEIRIQYDANNDT